MWYLYELSYGGVVFYVGMTRKPLERYKQHCGLAEICTHGFILSIRKNGELPEFNIVCKLNSKMKIMREEKKRIEYYVAMGHGLYNIAHNQQDNILNCKCHWTWLKNFPHCKMNKELEEKINKLL